MLLPLPLAPTERHRPTRLERRGRAVERDDVGIADRRRRRIAQRWIPRRTTVARCIENSSHYHRSHVAARTRARRLARARSRSPPRRAAATTAVEPADRRRPSSPRPRSGPTSPRNVACDGLADVRDDRPGRRRSALVRALAQGSRDDGQRHAHRRQRTRPRGVDDRRHRRRRVRRGARRPRRRLRRHHCRSGDDDVRRRHGADDPHVWFDPIRVAATLPAIADALGRGGARPRRARRLRRRLHRPTRQTSTPTSPPRSPRSPSTSGCS